MASSSILCYDCSTTSQEYCEKQQIVQTCNVGEVCRQVVHRLAPIFGGGVIAFQRGCFRNSICTESDECKGAFGGDCISCCNRNFCNNGAIDNLTTGNTSINTSHNFCSELIEFKYFVLFVPHFYVHIYINMSCSFVTRQNRT